MNILAIDTSTNYCSVAVKANGNIVSETKCIPQQHNRYLLSIVDKVITNSKLNKYNIDLLAYGVGPGSFTGVRLSASLIKAMAFVIAKPILGFSSMYAIAKNIHQKLASPLITIVLDAKIGDFYLGQFKFDFRASRLITTIEKCVSTSFLFKYLKTYPCGLIAGDPIKRLGISFDIIDCCPESQYMFSHIEKSYGTLKAAGKSPQDAMPVYLQGKKQWKKLNN